MQYACHVSAGINLLRPVNWAPIKIVDAEISMEIQTNNNIMYINYNIYVCYCS